jgi:hypothetical protein
MKDEASLSRLVRGLMTFAAVGVGLGFVAAAAAEPHESFAVVALVGDSLSIVNYQGVTGSSLDRNIQTQVPLTDGHFDQVAVRAAIAEVHRLDPDATVSGIDLQDPQPFADSDGLAADDARRPALLAALRSSLPTPQPHYLLVIAKARGDARLKILDGSIGSGKLTGIGFYIDTYKRLTKTSTGESGRGFIAPYAYVQVSLVDLRTGAVVRTEKSVESTTRANVGPDSNLDPWNALPADEKVRLLNGLLARAVRTGVAHVVAPG